VLWAVQVSKVKQTRTLAALDLLSVCRRVGSTHCGTVWRWACMLVVPRCGRPASCYQWLCHYSKHKSSWCLLIPHVLAKHPNILFACGCTPAPCGWCPPVLHPALAIKVILLSSPPVSCHVSLYKESPPRVALFLAPSLLACWRSGLLNSSIVDWLTQDILNAICPGSSHWQRCGLSWWCKVVGNVSASLLGHMFSF
jgi:hypothetical protein